VIDVEHWAEIRRMHFIEGVSIREIRRRTGLHRETIRRALAAKHPPAKHRRKKQAISDGSAGIIPKSWEISGPRYKGA
jgi:transposase